MSLKIRKLKPVDLFEVVALERQWTSHIDADFDVEVNPPWTLTEGDITCLVKSRPESPAEGNTCLYVVHDDYGVIFGAFALESHRDFLEIDWMALSADENLMRATLVGIAEWMKSRAKKSDKKQVSSKASPEQTIQKSEIRKNSPIRTARFIIRDSETAHFSKIGPILLGCSFVPKLLRSHFGPEDGWAFEYEAGRGISEG